MNDTGHPCHGFEIELEDIHPADVPYTFGDTYIRYGTPEVLDTTVDPAHPRVLVRYRRWNGSQWEETQVAPAGVTPGGHDCYSGGPIGNYATSGCEHYGVSLAANPSRTTYRWLVAANPGDASTAFAVVPEVVNVPVPTWNVIPQAGGGVNVRAEVEPVEEENHAQWGEPQWLKVFKIESDQDLQPEDLNKLLLGLAGGIVPPDTEVETEWKIIQSRPGDAEGPDEDADVKEDPLDGGKRSVIRRYEFYSYTGPRDPENNEAFPCVNDDSPVSPDAPIEGCSDLGDFVGAQNVAIDVDFSAVDGALAGGEVGVEYPATPLVIGGLAPYVVERTGGTLPDGLHLDAVTGILSGTPTSAGPFAFDLRATDSAGAVVTASFGLVVTEDLCPADPDKTAPGACGCGVPDLDSDGDAVADCVDLCPLDPLKSDPGLCGCDAPEGSCVDLCPDDPAKVDPGVCGCGVADEDVNANAVVDCQETVRADLAASVKQAPAKPRAGRRLRFVLRATNVGPDTAASVELRAALTGGPFSSLKVPRGCSGTPVEIVCPLGSLSHRRPGSKTRAISVVPGAGASITVDVTVSSPTYDPQPANQAATLTSLVP